jgi:hypothetical protein
LWHNLYKFNLFISILIFNNSFEPTKLVKTFLKKLKLK